MKTSAKILVKQTNMQALRPMPMLSRTTKAMRSAVLQRFSNQQLWLERLHRRYAWTIKTSLDRHAFLFAPLSGNTQHTTIWAPMLNVFFGMQDEQSFENIHSYRQVGRWYQRHQRERMINHAQFLMRQSLGWQLKHLRNEWESWFAFIHQPAISQEMSYVQQMMFVQDSIENWQKQLMRQSWHKRQLFAHQLQQLFQWYPLINETMQMQREQAHTFQIQELTYHELEQLTLQIQRSLLMRKLAMVPRKEEILLSDIKRLRNVWNLFDDEVISRKERLRLTRIQERVGIRQLRLWQEERQQERRKQFYVRISERWLDRVQQMDRMFGANLSLIHLQRVTQSRWQEWMSFSPIEVLRLKRVVQRHRFVERFGQIVENESSPLHLFTKTEYRTFKQLAIRQRYLQKQELLMQPTIEWLAILPVLARKPNLQLWLANVPLLQKQLTRIREVAFDNVEQRQTHRSAYQQSMHFLELFQRVKWQPEQINELLLQIQQRKGMIRIHENTWIKSIETQLLVQERINQVSKQMDQFLIGGQTGQQNTYYIRERLMKQLMHLNVNDWLRLFKKIQEGNWATSDEPFWSVQSRTWNRREERLYALYQWLMRSSGISESSYRSMERLNLLSENRSTDRLRWLMQAQERTVNNQNYQTQRMMDTAIPRTALTYAKVSGPTSTNSDPVVRTIVPEQTSIQVPNLQEWTKWPFEKVLDRMLNEFNRRARVENARRGLL